MTRENNNIPSQRPMPPSAASAQTSSDTAIMTGTSWRMSCWLTISGVISAEAPSMNSTLKMLLPTTLPIAMSAWPDQADCTDTAISGALVPNATTVRPTTSGEMPNDSDRREAPRTRSSAPATRAISPRANQNAVMGGQGSVGVGRGSALAGHGNARAACSPRYGRERNGARGAVLRHPLRAVS